MSVQGVATLDVPTHPSLPFIPPLHRCHALFRAGRPDAACLATAYASPAMENCEESCKDAVRDRIPTRPMA